jgi:hypothetical protein
VAERRDICVVLEEDVLGTKIPVTVNLLGMKLERSMEMQWQGS